MTSNTSSAVAAGAALYQTLTAAEAAALGQVHIVTVDNPQRLLRIAPNQGAAGQGYISVIDFATGDFTDTPARGSCYLVRSVHVAAVI